MYKNLFLLFFIIILSNTATAQENEYTPSTRIRGAYMGSIIYPGFDLGVERPYKVTQVNTVQSAGIKTIYKERYFSYNFRMYYHQTYHTNFLIQVEWVARRQYSKGLFLQKNFGIGLSRTFFDGETYTVSDDGKVSRVPMAGNFYGLLNMGGSIGYNFEMKKNKQFSIFLKPDLILMMPYNRFILPRPTIELGVSYKIKNFWVANPKRIYMEREQKKAETN